jgi:hypothetical protein
MMNKASSGRKASASVRTALSIVAGATLLAPTVDMVADQSAMAFNESSLSSAHKSELQHTKTNINSKEKGLASEKLVSNKLKNGEWANASLTPVQTTKARINLTKEISPRLLDDLVVDDLNLHGSTQKVPITQCSRTMDLYIACEQTLPR